MITHAHMLSQSKLTTGTANIILGLTVKPVSFILNVFQATMVIACMCTYAIHTHIRKHKEAHNYLHHNARLIPRTHFHACIMTLTLCNLGSAYKNQNSKVMCTGWAWRRCGYNNATVISPSLVYSPEHEPGSTNVPPQHGL